MSDTFAIRDRSEESILEFVQGTRRQRPELYPSRHLARSPQSQSAKTHEIMDVYVFCSTFLLWSTGLVHLIFSVYILLSDYAIASLVELELFRYTMVLQMCAAVVNLTAAGVTTSMIKLDKRVPGRSIAGFVLILLMLLLLVAEVVMGHIGKKEIIKKTLREIASLRKSVPSILHRRAQVEGFKCQEWRDPDCKKIYREHVNMFLNYLIGSALVMIATSVVTLPVYLMVFAIITRDLSRGDRPEVGSRLNVQCTPSLLSVQGPAGSPGTPRYEMADFSGKKP